MQERGGRGGRRVGKWKHGEVKWEWGDGGGSCAHLFTGVCWGPGVKIHTHMPADKHSHKQKHFTRYISLLSPREQPLFPLSHSPHSLWRPLFLSPSLTPSITFIIVDMRHCCMRDASL